MSKQQEKRARFARMFPARVDTLRDTLRKIANCSNKSNYDWDTEKVQEAWKLIAEVCWSDPSPDNLFPKAAISSIITAAPVSSGHGKEEVNKHRD